jgi:hypothetical protein
MKTLTPLVSLVFNAPREAIIAPEKLGYLALILEKITLRPRG